MLGGKPDSHDRRVSCGGKSEPGHYRGSGSGAVAGRFDAGWGTVIATKQVNDLPLNGRNFTQLLSLTPGVAPVSVAQNNMSGRQGGFGAPIAVGSAFIFPAINGQTNRSNFFLTDGLNNFGSFQSTYAVPPIVDAVQEFKVVSHTDSAEFGSVLGGVVNVVTKSGTNDLHGSVWEYVRNAAFICPAFLDPSQRAPGFRQNQFGASVGGPVWIPSSTTAETRHSSSLPTRGCATARIVPQTSWFRRRPNLPAISVPARFSAKTIAAPRRTRPSDLQSFHHGPDYPRTSDLHGEHNPVKPHRS